MRTFVKIRRGGEAFWAEVLLSGKTKVALRCDNKTTDPAAPAYNEKFLVDADEPIFGVEHADASS